MSENKPEDGSREEIRAIQNQKLKSLISEIIPSNKFWTKKFEAAGVEPASIKTVDDLSKLPITEKRELVEDQNENPLYGTNLTYDLSRYKRFHATSGTTGQPMPWLDTPESWNWWLECWRQIFSIVEVSPEDRLCFPFSFGPFVGFWAAFEGAKKIDQFVIAAGGMSSEARIQLILRHNITVICCTPTYAQRLAEVAANSNIDLAASSVRMLIVAGEPGGSIPATRSRIEKAWGARVFDHWGMTDIGALAIESVEDPSSLLMLETECIAEIVDPKTMQPVEPGEQGELILTNLGRTGMPLIRYRTGDLVQAGTTPNKCGRSLLRLEGGILGRSDDMITIRGNNVFPSSLEAVLREFPEIAEYRATVEKRESMHHMKLEIEPTASIHAAGESTINDLVKRCDQNIKMRLNFHAEISIVEPNSLPRFEMKGKRFFVER